MLRSRRSRLRRNRTVLAALLVYPWVLGLLLAWIGPPAGQLWEYQSAVFFNQLGVGLGVMTTAERAMGALPRRSLRVTASVVFAALVALVVEQNFMTQLRWPAQFILVFDDNLELTRGLARYRRVHFFPREGYMAFSLLKVDPTPLQP